MEINSKDAYRFKRGRKNHNSDKAGFAIFLVLFGFVLLFSNIGIISATYRSILFSWQTLVVVLGLWFLIKRNYLSGAILIIVGLFFLYPKVCHLFPGYFFCFNVDIRTYWPVLLILFGILLIVRKPSSHYRVKVDYDRQKDIQLESEVLGQNNSDYIDKNVVFGNSEQIVLSSNFRGGDGNVTFGELIIDLRKAKLAEGSNILELNVTFGNIIVYVPSSWVVEVKGSAILGSFDDKRYDINSPQESASRLIIKGNAIFGSGEIRN